MRHIKHIIICMAFLSAAVSCNMKKDAMGPEDVVEAFSRAVAAGDFTSARSFCDTLSMKDYLENYRTVLASLQKEDSCAVAIASQILSGADFEVKDIKKNGEERTVLYTLEAEGSAKTKKATLKREAGEWRVTSITDAI